MVASALVSVIVPIYNQEKYLMSSIPPLLGQSYPDVEVILVDDGSTNASGEICDGFMLHDNVRVIHQRKDGLADAVVKGVRCAKGDYICFVSPDDGVGRNFVSTFIAEMKEPYDIVAMGFYRNDNGILSPVSRKNGVFATAMDSIFREYFLRYRRYPLYFFMDAAYMICKINHIDGDVLRKVTPYGGNMYALACLLDKEYDSDIYDTITQLPQKLSWRYGPKTGSRGTFYGKIESTG